MQKSLQKGSPEIIKGYCTVIWHGEGNQGFPMEGYSGIKVRFIPIDLEEFMKGKSEACQGG
jgi:hypothetical protein